MPQESHENRSRDLVAQQLKWRDQPHSGLSILHSHDQADPDLGLGDAEPPQ